MTAVLQAEGLTCGYGKIVAVRKTDFEVNSGEILAILGPNGAGKSTLLMTLSGLLPRLGGDVRLAGQSLPSGKPGVANMGGLVLVPDNRALFTTLTVRENVEIAKVKGANNVDDVLDLFPALHPRLKLKAGALSGGEQQMLAMARGLVQSPTAFLIDEMSMGLAPIIVEELLPIVRRVADDTGAAIILVEQHVKLALEVADSAMVLVHGDVSLRGPAAELRKDPARLEAAYLGAGADHEVV